MKKTNQNNTTNYIELLCKTRTLKMSIQFTFSNCLQKSLKLSSVTLLELVVELFFLLVLLPLKPNTVV